MTVERLNEKLGFRRRCGWCGRPLRAWQLNLCRRCRWAATDAGIYLQGGGPPFPERSQWDSPPDRFRKVRAA